MDWLVATTKKAVASHVAQCVNRQVARIGKMTNSVLGWILTGFAKARFAYAIGVNAGMRMNSNIVNGIGG